GAADALPLGAVVRLTAAAAALVAVVEPAGRPVAGAGAAVGARLCGLVAARGERAEHQDVPEDGDEVLDAHDGPGLAVVSPGDDVTLGARQDTPGTNAPQAETMTMRALLLIDIQNDFLPGGALAVARGDEVIAVANRLTARTDLFGLVAM